ncbi:hypothetical protein L6452_03380 [Arctium lappa]|uniref:Uncharacterized protein n=1 Tax=Arctium lappa TaxID=4217 RepID=A0ACB9FLP6_ARCLA|nr:hypothetical protein L6452_03380 [Arctium lappa]
MGKRNIDLTDTVLNEKDKAAAVEYESRHKRYNRDHRHYDDQKETDDGEVWSQGAVVAALIPGVNIVKCFS